MFRTTEYSEHTEAARDTEDRWSPHWLAAGSDLIALRTHSEVNICSDSAGIRSMFSLASGPPKTPPHPERRSVEMNPRDSSLSNLPPNLLYANCESPKKTPTDADRATRVNARELFVPRTSTRETTCVLAKMLSG